MTSLPFTDELFSLTSSFKQKVKQVFSKSILCFCFNLLLLDSSRIIHIENNSVFIIILFDKCFVFVVTIPTIRKVLRTHKRFSNKMNLKDNPLHSTLYI